MRLWLGILLAWSLMALAGVWLGEADTGVHLERMLAGPSPDGWLGFDELGRDVALRLLAGAHNSFQVAVSVVALSAAIGTAVGLVSGYFGGWVDRLISGVIDIFLAFPGLLLAIGMAAVLGPGLENVVIALVTVGWVSYARLARAQALSLRRREHVLAARALGAGTGRILLRHLLPLMLAPLGVEMSFGVAGAVISEAGLSFLGLGVQPPEASWGSMIREGTRYMLVAPHLVLAPGLALVLVVLAANRLGDAWRDRLDVKQSEVHP
ncbi:ABC transporter permease [Sulfurivirga sp.]|uniref:ABC transporter permease n=1 Tax=Sulfurivirga sp. TaxID=2614236 RepID=UPI0025E6577C|nr:ABC transporter permease [Sulfurivirga sp.]